MEICQCERYKEIVNNTIFFNLGTMHPLIQRISVPENACIFWQRNKASHLDYRPNKPVLIINGTGIEEKKNVETFESKWIPVSPGVISQKIANESKKLPSPF